ncbi:MAG: hypothetical protein WDZ83_04840 [Rhizobiaceae bacterium]
MTDTSTTTDYPELGLFIAGAWRASEGRKAIPVVNPATETVLGALPVATHRRRLRRARHTKDRLWGTVHEPVNGRHEGAKQSGSSGAAWRQSGYG